MRKRLHRHSVNSVILLSLSYFSTIMMKIIVFLIFAFINFCESDDATSGVVYERWGKTDCPSSTEEVYDGFIGGGWYDGEGSGAEYLCLPWNPEYVETSTASNDYQSRMFSTEYRTNDLGFSNPTQHYDAPCVVCLAPRATKMMIPARASCPNSWTIEYTGYLMAPSYVNISNKKYVCVDMYAETIPGSENNEQGALLYFVVAQCDKSFMPCLTYINDVPLTCAVCTK